jgi:transposase
MSGLILSAEDRAHFLRLMRRQINSTVHRRINVLLLLDDGWEPRRIAEALYLEEGTVAQHKRRYETQGREGIERLDYVGRIAALNAEQQEQLAKYVDAQVPLSAKEVCAYSERAFGISYTPNAMTKLLKRLGFVHKKPKCVPAKADERAQREFVAKTLLPLMQAADDDVPVYFVDATHPMYAGRPAHGWMRKGTTRELKSPHGRLRLNINGALCWHDRTILHREEEKITGAAMIDLFEDIAARHPTASAIWVVMDNATYNRSRALKAWLGREGCRITPIYLPSYAPNLNMIERFWRFMKSKVLDNKYFPRFVDFGRAFNEFFDNIGRWNSELESLLTPKFHFPGGAPANGIP